MNLIDTPRRNSRMLSPHYIAFAESAASTIGDQQASMGAAGAAVGSPRTVRLRQQTRCPFCDSESYADRVVWAAGGTTTVGTCALCGTRCESRHLRRVAGRRAQAGNRPPDDH